MKNTFFILAIVALFSIGCNPDVLVDRYYDIPEGGWQYEETITDSFEVVQPGFYHLISSNLRITGDYQYANIHLKMKVTSPDGETMIYKVPIVLAEKSGKWLGSGLGDVLTFQAPILHRKFLDQKGKYIFTMVQDMRLESLPNIISAGFRVEQQEEIF